MRTNLFLGAGVVGLLITGAIAQTNSNIDRIKDPAGHQNTAPETEPKRNVRTVYPNTQNAKQAAQQSKNAQGKADASKRQAGDVTPLPAQQPSSQTAAPAAQPASAPAATQTAHPDAQPAQPSSPPPSTTQQGGPTATVHQSNTPSEPPAIEPNRQDSAVVFLNTQQQTSIGQAIVRHNVKPLTDVTFSMAVGTKVPAAVQLRALPSDLATFVPQYRGYSYVVVEEQIVIVDPGTHEIAAIVPYTAAAPATRVAETPKQQTPGAQKPMVNRSVNLNTEPKVSPRPAKEQRKATRPVNREYREERAPRTVTVEEFAEPRRVPVIREHRFFDGDDDVVVVPRQNGFFGLFR